MAKASDFVQAPTHLISKDRPLDADLYIFFQLNNTIVHFRRKGDRLSERDLAALEKVPRNCVLIPRTQWSKVMEMAIGDISMELEQSGNVDTAIVRDAAKSMLGGLDASFVPPGPLPTLPPVPSIDTGAPPVAKDARAGTHTGGAANPGNLGNNTNDAPAPVSPEKQAELARQALVGATPLIEKMITTAKKNRSTQAYEQVINEWKEDENPLISHQRQVSAVAVLFLLVLGGASYEDFSDVGLAGLLHDVGLLSGPGSIMSRHLQGTENYNPSEKLVFMKHIETTLEVIRSQGLFISPGAARIIQFHHENWDGSGFKGVKGAQIYRPARVLRLADGVVSRMSNPSHAGGFREALTSIAAEVGAGGQPIYDPGMIKILQRELYAGKT